MSTPTAMDDPEIRFYRSVVAACDAATRALSAAPRVTPPPRKTAAQEHAERIERLRRRHARMGYMPIRREP